MINLIPVVAPFALNGVAYIIAGLSGFYNSAWTSKLNDSGELTENFKEEYTSIDLKSEEFNTALQKYETEQKALNDKKISSFVDSYVPPVQEVSSDSVSSRVSFLDVFKTSSVESLEQQKILNNNLSALNTTLASMFSAKNSELVNQNQANAILSENLLALNKSMATLSTLPKITAEVNTSPKIANTVKMTPKFDVSMNNTIDVSVLAAANKTIAEGVENQIQTNAEIVKSLEKKNEHYDFQKEGTTDLKDSNGKQISPREVEAKKNAEQLIDQKDINETTIEELLEFTGDVFEDAGNEIGEILGATDGFDLNFNPLDYISGILLDGLKNDLEGKSNVKNS